MNDPDLLYPYKQDKSDTVPANRDDEGFYPNFTDKEKQEANIIEANMSKEDTIKFNNKDLQFKEFCEQNVNQLQALLSSNIMNELKTNDELERRKQKTYSNENFVQCAMGKDPLPNGTALTIMKNLIAKKNEDEVTVFRPQEVPVAEKNNDLVFTHDSYTSTQSVGFRLSREEEVDVSVTEEQRLFIKKFEDYAKLYQEYAQTEYSSKRP